jgi:DNA-binding transcriptional MerR regulator
MSDSKRTYTLDEIEELTGFDKRTIAYYVQEDVLPKVGRRGPRTRYPQLFLDRLLFIKRVRDLQDTGRVGSMTLGDFREVFEQLSAQEIADLAAGHRPIEPIAHGAYEPRLASPPTMASSRRRAELLSDPHEAASSRRVESSSERWSALGLARHARPVVDSPEPSLSSRVGELLDQLERSIGARETGRSPRSERWIRAHVTENITVSVRDLDERAADRLEELATMLRRSMPEDDRR